MPHLFALSSTTPVPGRCSLDRQTPWLELDVDLAIAQFSELRTALPSCEIHYAVKANPHPQLLTALYAAGSRFDVASPAEVDAALTAGASADEVVYSNPVKRRTDIASAAARGVRLFSVDSLEETHKVAEAAPGAGVLARILTSGAGSDWPLSRKFGCAPDEAQTILRSAADLGLDPAGVAFHVGSQQRDPHAWTEPIQVAVGILERARRQGLRPHTLNIGGGFPAGHEGHRPALGDYGRAIGAALDAALESGSDRGWRPRVICEPGRGIVGDAGEVVASVIAVIHRDQVRWVYLDVGVFTGLVETLDEAIRYRLSSTAAGELTPAVLAGPTCDSADVLYERTPVLLPADLREGDLIRLHSAGAYTSCYSTVGFNGFDPLPTHLGRLGSLVSH